MKFGAVDIEIMRLSRSPGPAGLDDMERLVLDRVAGEGLQRNGDTLGLSGLAAAVGLIIGVAGGAMPFEAQPQDSALSPLTGLPSVPSSVLMGAR